MVISTATATATPTAVSPANRYGHRRRLRGLPTVVAQDGCGPPETW
jgi:hypothetical protein